MHSTLRKTYHGTVNGTAAVSNEVYCQSACLPLHLAHPCQFPVDLRQATERFPAIEELGLVVSVKIKSGREDVARACQTYEMFHHRPNAVTEGCASIFQRIQPGMTRRRRASKLHPARFKQKSKGNTTNRGRRSQCQSNTIPVTRSDFSGADLLQKQVRY